VKAAHSYSQQLRLFGLLNCYIWNRPNFTHGQTRIQLTGVGHYRAQSIHTGLTLNNCRLFLLVSWANPLKRTFHSSLPVSISLMVINIC